MSIVSLLFPVFLLFIIGLYYIVPKKYQWYVIFLGNNIFYFFAGIKSYLVILVTSLFTYFVALLIQKKNDDISSKSDDSKGNNKLVENINNNKMLICSISIIFIICFWMLLKFGTKYNNGTFFVPLGISFYSLNAIAYLVDINREKYCAEKNFLKFLTYLMYFPHLTQGPFSRFDRLSKQIFSEHDFSYERFTTGLSRILFGYFKKLVIADKLSLLVNNGTTNYDSISGLTVLMVMILYSFQLYADFSGYMDIVCGISMIFGIESEENFRQPYLSKSIDEFWRRWHISLGLWFKDYLFYPIFMSKTVQKINKYMNDMSINIGKPIGIYIALFFVWTATGLWHDFSLNYLVWGYLNMLCIMLSMLLENSFKKIKAKLHIDDKNKAYNLFRILKSFLLVCIIRIFSITPSIKIANEYLSKLFSFNSDNNIGILAKDVAISQIIISVVGIIIILVLDILNENKKWISTKEKCPILVRSFIFALLIVCILLFAGSSSDHLKGFMYARF